MQAPAPSIVVLVGPTAVGKSALAMRLAPRFNADIVSADSRQVYRYMDIGTAKPSLAEQGSVRHYMLDLVEPDETYTAGSFKREGARVLRRIAAEGRLALIVGGTGFYLRALLDGLDLPAVAPDERLRQQLRAEAETQGPDALYARLRALDPRSADRIHPNNLPRVIRALEIVDALGGPVPSGRAVQHRALYIGLTMDRAMLRAVADRRVLKQVEAGLVRETEILLAMGYSAEAPALSGFGYREMVRYLRGGLSLDEAIAAYQIATHQYIRRQMTWFRQDARIHWLDADTAEEAALPLIGDWLATDASGSRA